jgi:O-succinylbenzoic acid--CoA ligase
MKEVTYKNVHNHFKLNGFHLDKKRFVQSILLFVKEGDEFEKSIGDFLLDLITILI